MVGDALSGGGAERAHASLSKYFVSNGIEVHNVIVQDLVSYDFSGELLNMGKFKNTSNSLFNKFKRFYILRKYIKTHKFNYILDFRMRRKPLQDILIDKFVYKAPVLYSVRSSFIDWYMPKQSWLTRLIYSKAYGIISINKKMKVYIEQRHGLKNVINIYNPVDLNYIHQRLKEEKEMLNYKYILAAGRMTENIKQFDILIASYAKSVLPLNNIKLVILGEGEDRRDMEKLSQSLGLQEHIIFKGFQENPYVYMRDAFFFALTSKFEGTPNVLLESLACGTPVIAFDCFTGPSEIIENNVNGLLIEDQDVEKFTEGLNKMFSDQELCHSFKRNAAASVDKFSIEKIGSQWLDFLKIQNI